MDESAVLFSGLEIRGVLKPETSEKHSSGLFFVKCSENTRSSSVDGVKAAAESSGSAGSDFRPIVTGKR